MLLLHAAYWMKLDSTCPIVSTRIDKHMRIVSDCVFETVSYIIHICMCTYMDLHLSTDKRVLPLFPKFAQNLPALPSRPPFQATSSQASRSRWTLRREDKASCQELLPAVAQLDVSGLDLLKEKNAGSYFVDWYLNAISFDYLPLIHCVSIDMFLQNLPEVNPKRSSMIVSLLIQQQKSSF